MGFQELLYTMYMYSIQNVSVSKLARSCNFFLLPWKWGKLAVQYVVLSKTHFLLWKEIMLTISINKK